MKKSSLAVTLIAALSVSLSGCGGGSSSSGSSGGGSSSASASSAVFGLDVSGLASGTSITVQTTDPAGSPAASQQSLTISGNGISDYPLAFQATSGPGGGVELQVTITAQPTNGEQCVLSSVVPMGVSNGTTWSFSPAAIPVYCSTPIKPAAYLEMGPFPGVGNAQVIASPKVVPVFLSGSANENADLTFLQQLVVSQYWGALTEYGVGNGTVETALYPTAPANLSSGSVYDAEIRSDIQSSNAWGATLTPNTVLAVFLPAGVTYTPTTLDGEPYGATGDHGQVSVNGVNIQFVAIPTISGGNEVQETAQYLIDAVTNPGGGGTEMAGSLGYVEASPNPDAYAGIFYHNSQGSHPDVNHYGQEFIELGNACDGVAPAESDISLPTGAYLYAIWSNSAASQAYASGNYGYCQPSFGETVDYASSPDAQIVTATRFGHTLNDQALVVPAGSSATVTVTAWGESEISTGNGATTAPWLYTVNPEITYTSGTSVPADCSQGTPNYEPSLVPSACANAPEVSVVSNEATKDINNPGSYDVTNGDTFTVTIRMPTTAEPGLWSILLSGTDGGTELPILVTNSTTWQ